MPGQPTSVLLPAHSTPCARPWQKVRKWLHGEHICELGRRSGRRTKWIHGRGYGEVDIDLSAHQTKTFQVLNDTSFDLVVSLSPEAQHSAVELTRWMACEVEYWPTINPEIFSGTRDQLIEQYRGLEMSSLNR